MRRALELEVAVERLGDVLADEELAEVLQVREPFEEQDAFDQLVGVLHLVDRFSALVLAELLVTPLLEHLGVQEVLVDRGELVLEDLVQVVEDFLVAFHRASGLERASRRRRSGHVSRVP